MQAEGAFARARAQHQLLEKWSFAACGPTCARTNPAALAPGAACGPACAPAPPPPPPPPPAYRGTLHALRAIAAAEGPAALWRGTGTSLLMAVPMVGIYLPLYDRALAEARAAGAGGAAPLLAGGAARAAAVYATAPFELLRTRLQAAAGVPRAARAAFAPLVDSAGGGALALAGGGAPRAARAARLRALRALWTGVGATLARDVPFSALYWAAVEPARAALAPAGASTPRETAAAAAAAGGAAGWLAGAATTPLDVAKTRIQLGAAGAGGGLVATLRGVAAREGAAALFRGWGARAAKTAPAAAIVLSAYELLKALPLRV
jgi:solute carrier family 25 protein 39/40